MSEAGPNKMAGHETNATGFGDTTNYTKIFVGGLAWETKRDSLKRYFEKFGDILEAVVINDKNTGRSKGYGFVTFKDADSAARACYNPFPVIDGRRANCNIAALGVQRNRPTSGMEKYSPPPPRVMAPSSSTGTPPFYRQFIPQYAFPYSAYGYPGYTQDIYSMNYYNCVYGGQQLPSHYTTTGISGSPGVHISYIPFYPQHGQSSPSLYPKATQHYRAFGTLAALPQASLANAATDEPATAEVAGRPAGGTASAQNSPL